MSKTNPRPAKIARRLRELCDEWSRPQLCAALGISPATLDRTKGGSRVAGDVLEARLAIVEASLRATGELGPDRQLDHQVKAGGQQPPRLASDAERDAARRLRQRGWSGKALAKEVGTSASTISRVAAQSAKVPARVLSAVLALAAPGETQPADESSGSAVSGSTGMRAVQLGGQLPLADRIAAKLGAASTPRLDRILSLLEAIADHLEVPHES